eukprot:SAG22_NODE_2623_length_2364_cov_1.576600_3_plen_193_part_00
MAGRLVPPETYEFHFDRLPDTLNVRAMNAAPLPTAEVAAAAAAKQQADLESAEEKVYVIERDMQEGKAGLEQALWAAKEELEAVGERKDVADPEIIGFGTHDQSEEKRNSEWSQDIWVALEDKNGDFAGKVRLRCAWKLNSPEEKEISLFSSGLKTATLAGKLRKRAVAKASKRQVSMSCGAAGPSFPACCH